MITTTIRQIYQHSFYFLEYLAEVEVVTFRWQDKHSHMTFEDFTEACTNYVGFILEYGVDKVIVDTRNFQFQLPEEFSDWKDHFHYPRLRKTGLKKMAFLMPETVISYMKNLSQDENGFALHYFAEEAEAISWLQIP